MKSDVVIVGAGIAGLSLAWTLASRGKSVVVLERGAIAKGASVRNFGMVWPVGHPLGEMRKLALRSREIWLDVARETELWVRECGAMTRAYEEIEIQVLAEFLEQADQDPGVGTLISAGEVLRRNPHVKSKGLLGAMTSETELCVDPRVTVGQLASALAKRGVPIHFNTLVGRVEPGVAIAADGQRWEADQIIVCATPDSHQLVPEANGLEKLRRCDLHMMRLAPKSSLWPVMSTHLCAGLTLGHYANFRSCPSLDALKVFHAEKWPSQTKYGIHVLVSQHGDGSLTVGDSHTYGDDSSPYLQAEIESSILEALDEFLDTSGFEVRERWIGTYSTSPGQFYAWMPVAEGVHALNLFGTGMTLSFGVAERIADELG